MFSLVLFNTNLLGILVCVQFIIFGLTRGHGAIWTFFQTINTFIKLGAISRPRNLSSKLSSIKGKMGWNPSLSNKNSIRSSSSSNISSAKGVFSNSLYGQSWLWQGNNKTSGILLYIFPRVVQGEALEFALLCNDWQTCQAGIKHQPKPPKPFHAVYPAYSVRQCQYAIHCLFLNWPLSDCDVSIAV